jgi:hypothetical protein
MGENLKQAWDDYNAVVEAARGAVEARPVSAGAAQRAAGYRCLAEAQAMAYNWAIAPRTDHPRIVSHTVWSTYYFTLAGNCTDFIYSAVFLDGRRRYRLRGRFGDVRLVLLQVFNGLMGSDGTRCISNHEWVHPPAGADDTIDIVLGPQQEAGHWIALDAGSRYNVVLIRRLMGDWFDDKGDLDIEARDPAVEDGEDPETALAGRLAMAGGFVKTAIYEWGIALVDRTAARAGVNNWMNVAGAQMAAIGGSATCNYAFMVYDIQPDEALVIEMEAPRNSAFWSFQLFDMWSRSLDFMHRHTDINMRRAWVDADGKVRAVISLEDPGVNNWLDPAGLRQGFCAMRNYLAATQPAPNVTLMKFGEVLRHLPEGTPLVDAAGRAAMLRHRRLGVRRLYDL